MSQESTQSAQSQTEESSEEASQRDPSKQRIAKYISRAGGPSRRQTERLIEDGLIEVNNKVIDNPATFVDDQDLIRVEGRIIAQKQPARLWAFYKPVGYITSEYDPDGRPTIYDLFPENTPRLLTVGRLDLNSEGLLLMTNDGELKRQLELPKTGISRHYRVRVFGSVNQSVLDGLAKGVVVDRVHYAPIHASVDKVQKSNMWLNIILQEGKNREIRKVMEHIGLRVNRLIRTDYGPFALGKQREGTLEDIPQHYMKKSLEDLKVSF